MLSYNSWPIVLHLVWSFLHTFSDMFSILCQLDLRCGAKKSLADPPRQSFVLKSCDINMTRPHLLLVGGRYCPALFLLTPILFCLPVSWYAISNVCSDAFARLYDRRMLSPLSASRQKLQPPPCVNYYCPTHLSDRVSSSLISA